eukprot:CAMPEP_0170081354 /NCGR_PEP_ID=MMETSP0019_2-20121128/17238_1 /TAXON_ID=98059 /ORGANISM="Dinobryon sp., Strain UTEXLB2267" /LENGTH=89 /DNA_ID=CAMNT_0010295733 /DNA_START=307 /DNA_END=576 /DNA_ORIENTATION=-
MINLVNSSFSDDSHEPLTEISEEDDATTDYFLFSTTDDGTDAEDNDIEILKYNQMFRRPVGTVEEKTLLERKSSFTDGDSDEIIFDLDL